MILRSIRNEAGTVPRGGGKTATVAKGWGRRAGARRPQATVLRSLVFRVRIHGVQSAYPREKRHKYSSL